MAPLKRLAWGAALALALLAAAVFAAGELLSRPASRTIGPPPAWLQAQALHIPTGPGQFVAGWFAPGQARGAVLLLHGVRADRTQMLQRAAFLQQAGYATLLIDLPAHGESSGDRITFGARESLAVGAALAHLRQALPGVKLGVIGVSLGGAATVLADLQPAPDAVILESMYPTIEEAVADRLTSRLGPAGRWLAPLLLWQLPLRAGVQPAALHPIEHLPRLGAPVLIAAGAADRHTPWAETQRLFDAAQPPRQLWKVEGAAHVDLCSFQPDAYQRRVLAFFQTHLRAAAQPPAGPSSRV